MMRRRHLAIAAAALSAGALALGPAPGVGGLQQAHAQAPIPPDTGLDTTALGALDTTGLGAPIDQTAVP
ncbi:MAG: hypothetical protein JWR30_3504, partial [Conexibacter sp.]|nr:hypothetical protein [Conexibacter sp.]